MSDSPERIRDPMLSGWEEDDPNNLDLMIPYNHDKPSSQEAIFKNIGCNDTDSFKDDDSIEGYLSHSSQNDEKPMDKSMKNHSAGLVSVAQSYQVPSISKSTRSKETLEFKASSGAQLARKYLKPQAINNQKSKAQRTQVSKALETQFPSSHLPLSSLPSTTSTNWIANQPTNNALVNHDKKKRGRPRHLNEDGSELTPEQRLEKKRQYDRGSQDRCRKRRKEREMELNQILDDYEAKHLELIRELNRIEQQAELLTKHLKVYIMNESLAGGFNKTKKEVKRFEQLIQSYNNINELLNKKTKLIIKVTNMKSE